MFNKLILVIIFSLPSMAQSIPTSTRSKLAIAKVTPQLQQEFKQKGLVFGSKIFIRIFKQEAQLEIWVKKSNQFHLFKSYPICTYGSQGLGPKLAEGDGKAPEGFYVVTAKQLNPYSNYHLSFNLGYPNQYDRAHKRTGSALMVHGDCVSVGCYAMTDEKIEEIYSIVNAAFINGQKFFRVHIFPFKMTQENMQQHKESPWYEFWQNLKQGYDAFADNNHTPPDIVVKNLKYVVK